MHITYTFAPEFEKHIDLVFLLQKTKNKKSHGKKSS